MVSYTFLEILALLIAANGAPVLAARTFGPLVSLPVDGGRKLSDGRPLFGASKTWRGVIAALGASVLLGVLLGYDAGFGLVFGALVIAGDLLSSFVKRRRGLAPSSKSTGLDQLPESILPSIYTVTYLGIEWWWAPLWAVAFMLLEILVSPLLFRLHIRKNPY
jgi:CDP-2,3-bis-(O-geranylgeranyl)-sn-glycerol synthase